MRDGLDAATLALYTSGEFELHTRLSVENGSGTRVNLSGRYTKYDLRLPDPSQPIGSLSIDFIRETTAANAVQSLAPTVVASNLNRLDDGVTYSPLLQLGRLVYFDVALTAVGAARPDDASTLWYEVFRGYITRVDWPQWDSRRASIECNDQAGILEIAKSEQAYTYAAGTPIETVARQILDNNGFTDVPLYFPAATGKVLPNDYTPGLQKTVWSQLWALAQSMGWVAFYRYRGHNPPELTFFAPAREKTEPDMTVDAYDFRALGISEQEVRNVGYLAFFDADGSQQLIGPFENAASIAKYGGSKQIRRPFWIKLEEDSPIRSMAEATDMLNAALSDVSDPDAVASALLPPMVFAESGVDLYEFVANPRLFDSNQTLAPFSITVSQQAGQDPVSTVDVRGVPTAGAQTWLSLATGVELTTLEVRYSGPAEGQNISATFNPALHVYMQIRRTDQEWPDEWVGPIVGEDGDPGADGVYYDYRFRVAATQPATPTGANPSGWFDAPPPYDPELGEKLWMTRALKNAADDSLLGTWSTPVQLTGPQGPSGQAGIDGITALLSNDAHVIPTDAAGDNGVYTGAETTISVYQGAADVSAQWSYSAVASSGVTGSLVGRTYTVTNMTVDRGHVDITATRGGFPSLTVRFTLSKSKQGVIGEPATAYWLITDVAAIKRSAGGTYTPASLNVQGRSATGTSAPVAYAGRFQIATTTDGVNWTTRYTSGSNQSAYNYGPIPANTVAVRVRLYAAGGTMNLLDEEIVPVVDDGPPGDTFGHPPTAHIVALAATDLTMDLRYSGTLGTGATGPLQWRVRIDREGGPEGLWGPGAGDGWVTASGANALPYTEAGILRDPRWDRIVKLEVRDANGQLTPAQFTIMPADIRRGGIRGYDAIEEPVPGAGYNIAPTVEDSSGREIRSFYGKPLPGDPDNFGSIIDGGGYVKPTQNEVTGGGRAYSALDTDNELTTGLKPIALVDGRSARDVRLLAEKPGHNLLVNPGFEEGDVGWTGGGFSIINDPANARTGNFVVHYQSDGVGGPNFSPELNIKLSPGDRFRLGMWTRSPAGIGLMRLAMRFYDANGTHLSTGQAGSAAPSAGWTYTSGIVTAPAGAVEGRLDIGENSSDNTATPWYIDDVSVVRVVEVNEAVRGSTTLDGILQNVTDAGHAGSGMQDSGGREIRRFLGKPFVSDPDTLDGVPNGTSFVRTTPNEKTGAARGFAAINSSNRLTTGWTSTTTDNAGRNANLFLAKGLIADPDHLASIADGGGYRKPTINEATGGGRAYSALDSSNELVTAVARGASVDGVPAYLAARQAHGVFIETFDQIPPGMNSTGGVSITPNGITGANAMRVTAVYRNWYGNTGGILIPFDPSKLYRVRVRVRVVTDDSGGTNQSFYAGVRGLSRTGSTIGGTGGNYYVTASNKRPVAADGWVEYTGWIRGRGTVIVNAHDPRNPSGMHADVTHITPMMLINYSTPTTQVTEVDYFAIDVFDEVASQRLYGTIAGSGLLSEGTAGQQSGGTIVKSIPKGVVGGTCYHKQPVVFDEPYQNAPRVIFLVPAAIENRAKWGNKAAVDSGTANGSMPLNAFIRPRPVAADMSSTGFTPELYIEAKSAPVQRSAVFLSASGVQVGQSTGSATPNSAHVPAMDNTYRCRVRIDLTNMHMSETWSGSLTVALRVSTGGAFTEVAAATPAFHIAPGDSDVLFVNLAATVAGIDGVGGDAFQVQFKSITPAPQPSIPVAELSIVEHLNWTQDPGALYASMTPDGPADAIPYLVIADG